MEEEKAIAETQKTKFSAYAMGGDENDELNPEALTKVIHDLLKYAEKQAKDIKALQTQLGNITEADGDVAVAFSSKKL